MEAGRLRRRVAIQAKTASQSATTGAVTYSWATAVTVWGSVEDISAREVIQNASELQTVTTRIVIRYLSTVTPEMRAVSGGVTYDIESVIADAGHKQMTLLCSRAI